MIFKRREYKNPILCSVSRGLGCFFLDILRGWMVYFNECDVHIWVKFLQFCEHLPSPIVDEEGLELFIVWSMFKLIPEVFHAGPHHLLNALLHLAFFSFKLKKHLALKDQLRYVIHSGHLPLPRPW
ncbi:hypothetical protein Fot_32939 [Forsythia ovata]|uniref:Uncharacterized protein n=1 Tax=Forsythia ovata TaxID=205694 RepID=A0ABD1T980_9LAMI